MAQKKATARQDKDIQDRRHSSKQPLLKAVDTPSSSPVAAPPNSTAPADLPKAKTVGESLKIARRAKDEPTKSIAAKLRISEQYLKAIESMDDNNLPEQVYALGFVRSYAHYLGLDPQKAVTQFKEEIFEPGSIVKKLSVPQHLENTTLPTKRILWVSTLAVLIFLGLTRYYWSTQHVDTSLEEELASLLRPAS